ncbi:MAG: YtxH domain-containing protein, partial [Dialister invisus]|nr:YtxH domain-containing protein [Dialister invisus]
ATAVKENIKDMPTQTAYAVHSAKEKAKSNVSDFKRGIVQGQETRQSQRADKLQQHRQNIADKRMELQKAQEAKQAGRTTDGSATTGATRPHDRPITASKTGTGKMQESKRPVTTDKVHTEPTTPQSVKERPLASGTEKRTSEPVSQPQRQTVRRTVEQTNKTERTLSSQQKQTNYQKNQQTVKKTTTKKGRRK